MQVKLTWNDLLIQNISESDARTWLDCWAGKIPSRVAPIFMSKFGDWFLRLPNGSTDKLSVIDGNYSLIASSPEEFTSLVNTQKWQEEHLMSLLIRKLHERKMIPEEGQCYAFAPHPFFTGRIEIDHVMLIDIRVWQHICAQTVSVRQEESKAV